MSRTLSYTAVFDDEGKRLDVLACERGLYSSRSAASRFIEAGRVFVNGAPIAKRYLVSSGDFIVYDVEEAPQKPLIQGEDIALDIRYEDDNLLVLSKQADLVCHPSMDHFEGTLVNALIFHCGIDNLCNVQGEDDRMGIVHRLDKDTTGLMLAAKSDTTGMSLMQAIRNRSVDRRYLALVQGNIAHDSGMIDAPITRSPQDRTRMMVRDTDAARESVTTFKVLERFEAGPKDDGFTLVECKLLTGRTHQIRVHMHYIKHACVGDPVYKGGSPQAQLGLKRQFLHSYLLDFNHPDLHQDMHFVDNLASDLQQALDTISERSRGRTEAGDAVFAALAACT